MEYCNSSPIAPILHCSNTADDATFSILICLIEYEKPEASG
jgi:hypothetical protein